MSTAFTFSIVANFCGFVIIVLLCIGTLLGSSWKQPASRWFLILLLLALMGQISEVIIYIVIMHPVKHTMFVVRFMDCFSYILWGMQTYAFVCYAYEYISTKKTISNIFIHLSGIFTALNALLAIIAQFTNLYGVFDASYQYHQKKIYGLSALFPTFTIIICIVLIMQNKQVLKKRECVSFILYGVTFVATSTSAWLVPDLWIEYFGGAIAGFFIYANVQVELKHQVKAQQTQLEEGRIAILLSQIHPHFLYNSLTAISKLCYGNKEAQQALLAFSQYLRVNMNSLLQKKPIPFENELEHTRKYLWLEELCAENKLRVIYDIKVADFMLPVLTLQPIVENAVCHGITGNIEIGEIAISTKEDAHCFAVIVKDNGIGFDPSTIYNDENSHLGIENVRSRLSAVCGGNLKIESMPGHGTIVTMEIPK